MKFDDVLAEVKGFGPFQYRLMLSLMIPRLAMPLQFMLNNFIAFIPPHHCNVSALDDGDVFRNLSSEERLIVSIPVEGVGSLSSCQMFAEPQYHLLLNSSNTTVLPTVHCQNGWVYDTSIMKSTLATEWDLVCERKKMNRSTATIFFLGVMLGSAVFGQLSDRFGRKTALLVSYVITMIFGFGSALSTNFAVFAVLRFFTGFGASGAIIASGVLCMEWADIKHRSLMLIVLTMDWSLGCSLLAALAYLVNDWRYLTVAATSPLLPGIIYWWWLPESARWLVSQKKDLLKRIVLENEKGKYSFLDLMKTPAMRRLTLITGPVWFGVACSYYGITLNVSGFGVNIFLTQLIYGTIEIPAKIVCFFSINKLGRKLIVSGGLLLTGLCLICVIFIPSDMAVCRTAVGTLGKFFSEAAFTVLCLYTAELYPTVVRQIGYSCCSIIGRLGVALSPLVALLDEVWVGLPRLLFGLMASGAGLLTFLLPETNNVTLAETIQDVEQRK
ncbi:solute carrier family 22 member 7-like isoform X2 [Syngnathus scovelli]|uniref:solute carrier family 22 member 7-like isoform X2 n=1 Tax=Syngnathus scovelli TaxID=161590 RepID=UPI00211023E0|nr:solute carrier family 22 member 7-like isoform X2 [Syngnathus scovelli]